MALFKKKKQSEEETISAEIPTDHVSSLKQQGYTDTEIIQSLQGQGYSPQEINQAFSQVEESTPETYDYPTSPSPTASYAPAGDYEGMIEAIVEDKWQEFNREMTKIKGWKEKTDTRLDRIEQQLNDVKTDIDSLHKAIIGKISDYDKNLLDVGTEVKAMEKVFSKIIPTLTESINELSLATKKIKSKK